MSTEDFVRSLKLDPELEHLAIHVTTHFAPDMIRVCGEPQMWYWAVDAMGDKVEQLIDEDSSNDAYQKMKAFMREARLTCQLQALLIGARNPTSITREELDQMSPEQVRNLTKSLPDVLNLILLTRDVAMVLAAPIDLAKRHIGEWSLFSDYKIAEAAKAEAAVKAFRPLAKPFACPVCDAKIEKHLPGDRSAGEPGTDAIMLCCNCGHLLVMASNGDFMEASDDLVNKLRPDQRELMEAARKVVEMRNFRL
jgi:hypothetical protein